MEANVERLLVVGAGGHGRVVAELISAAGRRVAGFVDADESRVGTAVEPTGTRVVASQAELLLSARRGQPLPELADGVVVAIGDNNSRIRVLEQVLSRSATPLIHPSACVSLSAYLGRGTVVLAHVVVNAAARIGNGVILNSACIIEHDCAISDGAHISPGAILAGGVVVAECAWIGAGAVVIEGRRIGCGAVIGAGAVVVHDVPDGMKVAGVPARPLVPKGTTLGQRPR